MEHLDHLLTGLAGGATLPVVLLVALLLGLRHASDPDHLAAVAPLATGDPGDRRRAVGLGLAWGAGHASVLVLVGVPLILSRAEVPEALGAALERTVGVMIVVLALLALLRWAAERRASARGEVPVPGGLRRRRTAFGIGVVHGLAGTGAVALLLLALLPSQGAALVALALFAPATMVSMAAVTAGWTWALTRPALARLHRAAVVPAVSTAALVFGLAYVWAV